ncbi:unnamed protein product [Vitrella brassicaformis CCMP3155]|uniref:Uncharacterized protein n=1 Tax=Vitrella brassicaformis (strain CCMP3155) TaxID=1169540 RepID=A0A0G4G6H5_VITBC|nr:unnamed protein product [Vitrella brassicaformis CCMP3155]|eukprot:CEM24132.1 unnamed protein product [Vitrella brassicaformis CCMP3155]
MLKASRYLERVSGMSFPRELMEFHYSWVKLQRTPTELDKERGDMISPARQAGMVLVLREAETYPPRSIHLVGVPPGMERSSELVREVIGEVRPGAVMVACDESRSHMLNPNRTITQRASASLKDRVNSFRRQFRRESTLEDVKDNQTWMDARGLHVGQEMVDAVSSAKECGATILLGDQPLEQTAKRLLEAEQDMGRYRLLKWVNYMVHYNTDTTFRQYFKEQDDDRKTLLCLEVVDTLSQMMRSQARPLFDALVSERGVHMADVIRQSTETKVVAAMDLLHVSGVAASLGTRYDKTSCTLVRLRL